VSDQRGGLQGPGSPFSSASPPRSGVPIDILPDSDDNVINIVSLESCGGHPEHRLDAARRSGDRAPRRRAGAAQPSGDLPAGEAADADARVDLLCKVKEAMQPAPAIPSPRWAAVDDTRRGQDTVGCSRTEKPQGALRLLERDAAQVAATVSHPAITFALSRRRAVLLAIERRRGPSAGLRGRHRQASPQRRGTRPGRASLRGLRLCRCCRRHRPIEPHREARGRILLTAARRLETAGLAPRRRSLRTSAGWTAAPAKPRRSSFSRQLYSSLIRAVGRRLAPRLPPRTVAQLRTTTAPLRPRRKARPSLDGPVPRVALMWEVAQVNDAVRSDSDRSP
jgi:hypothetical protein